MTGPAVVLWLAVSLPALADEPELSLADLAAYRDALETSTTRPAPAVTFRDLWDHPERFEGRRVRVEGTLQRRFRQGAVGKFPALVEDWAVTRSGDAFCLVHPDPGASGPLSKVGDRVGFEGTFLRKIRYRGSDTARLAPLVVGNRPPSVLKPGATRSTPFVGDRFWLDVSAALAVGLVIASALARRHLRKPPRVPPRPEPPPEFLEASD